MKTFREFIEEARITGGTQLDLSKFPRTSTLLSAKTTKSPDIRMHTYQLGKSLYTEVHHNDTPVLSISIPKNQKLKAKMPVVNQLKNVTGNEELQKAAQEAHDHLQKHWDTKVSDHFQKAYNKMGV